MEQSDLVVDVEVKVCDSLNSPTAGTVFNSQMFSDSLHLELQPLKKHQGAHNLLI